MFSSNSKETPKPSIGFSPDRKLTILFGNVNIFVLINSAEDKKSAENNRQESKNDPDNQGSRAFSSLKRIQEISGDHHRHQR